MCAFMCVFFFTYICACWVCFHVRVRGAFTVNQKKKMCVCLSVNTRSWREERGMLISKSSGCVPRIKYLGRRSLDLHALAQTPGSHWFLTTHLGHYYNKMHYSQLHSSTPPPANLHWPLCMCCAYPLRWSQVKVFFHSLPGRLLTRTVDQWK